MFHELEQFKLLVLKGLGMQGPRGGIDKAGQIVEDKGGLPNRRWVPL